MATLVAPIEDLVANFPSDHPAQRLTALVGTLTPLLLSDETLVRTVVRCYMDNWLTNQRDGTRTPVRAGRRMRWIDEALRPLDDQLSERGRTRLRS